MCVASRYQYEGSTQFRYINYPPDHGWPSVHNYPKISGSILSHGGGIDVGRNRRWPDHEDGQITKHDLLWLIQGMTSGSLIWVTDGSYDRKRAPVISGVGWIILCTHTGKRLVGSFWEKSSSASSYRAELLGLCSLHLLALALSEFFMIKK